MIIGIDSGINGAIALLSDKHTIEIMEVMPSVNGAIDNGALSQIFEDMRLRIEDGCAQVIIELVAGRPGQGAGATFKQGVNYGAVVQAASELKYPTYFKIPTEWQNASCKGLPGIKAGLSASARKRAVKERSLMAAKRIFPTESFLATQKSKVPHDGLVDAALIAYSGFP